MKTAEEIKQFRLSLKLSQEAFARILGVRSQTVVRWENKHHIPSPIAQHLLDEVKAGLEKQNVAGR